MFASVGLFVSRVTVVLLAALWLAACAPVEFSPADSTGTGVAPSQTTEPGEAVTLEPATLAPVTPTIPNPTAQASSPVLYFEYEGFELEGIPPYASPYVTLHTVIRTWVDTHDPLRFREERYYAVTQPQPAEGLQRIAVGTGTGGVVETCRYYEGTATCSEEPITNTVTYDEWLKNRFGQRWLDNIETPEAIGGYTYQGTQNDLTWGEVHVFERQGSLATSDLYPGHPTVETLTFDVALLRGIEWKRMLTGDENDVLHAYSRLVAWEMLSPSEAPLDLFALGPRQPATTPPATLDQ